MRRRFLAVMCAMVLALSLVACGGSNAGGNSGSNAGGDAGEADGVRQGVINEGKLSVIMECAYAPYNWTQPDDSNGAVPIKDSNDFAYGYDVMMAKYVAEELGLELEIIRSDWDSIIPALQSSTVDLAICGQSITSERLEMADFTDPYYYATIVTLVPEDSQYADAASVADLAGGKCTSQLNTIWYDKCLPQIPDAEILPGQESAPAMTVALTSGSVDYVVCDQPTGLAAVAANPGLKMLEFTGEGAFEVSEEDINIGISLLKGNTELQEAVNGVLANLTPEDFTNWMNDAIAVQPLSE